MAKRVIAVKMNPPKFTAKTDIAVTCKAILGSPHLLVSILSFQHVSTILDPKSEPLVDNATNTNTYSKPPTSPLSSSMAYIPNFIVGYTDIYWYDIDSLHHGRDSAPPTTMITSLKLAKRMARIESKRIFKGISYLLGLGKQEACWNLHGISWGKTGFTKVAHEEGPVLVGFHLRPAAFCILVRSRWEKRKRDLGILVEQKKTRRDNTSNGWMLPNTMVQIRIVPV